MQTQAWDIFFHIEGVYKSKPGIHQAKMSVPLLDVCRAWMSVLRLHVSTGTRAQTHTYTHIHIVHIQYEVDSVAVKKLATYLSLSEKFMPALSSICKFPTGFLL